MNGKTRLAILGVALLGVCVALGVMFVADRIGDGDIAIDDLASATGTFYQNPDPAPAFELTADTGDLASLESFRGKVVLLYFGYTFCPDICPASLAELAIAVGELDADQRDDVQVLMISVDPTRDTTEVLADYMDHFDPSFVGLTGSDAEIATVASDYNVFYQAHEGSAATGYLVDHWAGTYVIDRDGRLVGSFSFGTTGEAIADDLEGLL